MKELILARGGESRYHIEGCPGTEFAAGELAAYIEKICGVRLPEGGDGPALRLLLPEGDAHAYRNAEGFVIEADGEDILIRGEGPRGVIYGVYTLLEDCFGCRFFAEDCELIPPAETLALPGDLHMEKHPAFCYRDVFLAAMSPACKVKNKVNATLPKDIPGGQFFFAEGLCHTICQLAEMENVKTGDQPCLTDEKVFRTVLKNCRKWLDANPDAAVISVTQNDGYGHQGGCVCERCREIDEREGSFAGTMISFVNRIAEALEPDYPDVLVDTFAYRYTRKAPRTVRPRHNVVVRFCTIESCFTHPIESECRATEDSIYGTVSLAQDLRDWSAISGKLFIWDYCTNFSRYLMPFPDLFSIRENVNFFYKCNAIGVFEEGDYQNKVDGELNALRAYLLAKLLWDPDMDEETYRGHMLEFLQNYYGAAWEPVYRYILSLHERALRQHSGIYSYSPTIFGYEMMNPESTNAFRADYTYWVALFDEADALADSDAVRHRLQLARLSLEVLKVCAPGVLSFLPEAITRERLYPRLKEMGIEFYREGTRMD